MLDTGFNANINKHQDENKNGVLVSDNSQQLICALRVCVGQQSLLTATVSPVRVYDQV